MSRVVLVPPVRRPRSLPSRLRRLAPRSPGEPAADRAPDWVAGGTPQPLRAQLEHALGSERVLTRASDLIRYASDASPYRLIPRAVALPRELADVQALIAFARTHRTPLTFRAGGTSLNGQAQSDSLLVDVRRHWQRIRVLDGGARVRVQPGAVLGHVNRVLARHGRRLGPDPASSDIACVGGVVANNSGGMRCGVRADSYRTVRAMKLVLANGSAIDTAAPDAEASFAAAAPQLAEGLRRLRSELLADEALAERVARKFQIKNTTGYRLCALLDAETPLEIFRRLVIGSEGTLAFVAEATFETVPWPARASIALIPFVDVDAAAAVVGELVGAGATATELMVAPTLIAASYNMPGTPASWRELPPTSAALLVELRAEDERALAQAEERAHQALSGHDTLERVEFSRRPERIEMLWRVREGMQGLLAAIRPPGATLIIEDVCVAPERIAEAARDLQALLGEHGFLPGVAGHASAGNLHFLLTPNFGEQADLERYERFMNALVELIVGKYDGSLKAEHGTGLNMAPFVEREWGSRATEMMWEIKRLADPDAILNPGAVLNRTPDIHLQNLCSTPEIEPEVTKCIECGFCEPVCPSRNATTTPRQRIVLRREMARQPAGSPVAEQLLMEYEHDAIDTCAADSSCALACPVAIDTGALVKRLRTERHDARAQRAGVLAARRFALLERGARAALAAGALGALVLGDRGLQALSGALRSAVGEELIPRWSAALPRPAPGTAPLTVREGAAAVYLPACLNRIFGPARDDGAAPSVPESLVAVSARAGLPLWIPPDAPGRCCALPWSSKGYAEGAQLMREHTAAALSRWSEGGALVVVSDASSCAQSLKALAPEGVQVLDAIEWVHDRLLGALSERLERGERPGAVAVHATCSATQLGLAPKLAAIAARLGDPVIVPVAGGCCGMGGDRGLHQPELPASALERVASELGRRELEDGSIEAFISSNRTCEIALREVTGRPYESFVQALERLTRM
jgi:D-lactate dehydrogenase